MEVRTQAVNVFERAKPDTDSLRPFADIDGVGGIGALLPGKFDERGGLVASGCGFKHGGAVRPSIERRQANDEEAED